MTSDYKESLLAFSYLGFLLDIVFFGGKKEGKTATIKETGEVYTYEQLEEIFKNKKK